MQTETGTAGPCQGARPTETERCDSSGRQSGGEAASAIGVAIGLVDIVAIQKTHHVPAVTVSAVTITTLALTGRVAGISEMKKPIGANVELGDAIVVQIARLAAAANSGEVLALGGGTRVAILRVPVGFAVEQAQS